MPWTRCSAIGLLCCSAALFAGFGCGGEPPGGPPCEDGVESENCGDGNLEALRTTECWGDCGSVCGDGNVQGDEECDDGNDNNNDACRNDCTAPICGDGVLDPGEQCDDGDEDDYDDCRNDCTCAKCGDGVVDYGEECDDGNDNENDGCRNDCTEPVCGDGLVDPGEQCDDGNDNDTDGCRNNCTVPTSCCGDGVLNPGEQCDDGNDVNNDGCRNDCTLSTCGDGILDPGEQCDDGNDNNDDGCRNDCTNYMCPVCPFCGNGEVDNGEECDDGNDNNEDDCRNNCTVPTCGDGVVDAGEECDDGNSVNTDSCRNDCTAPVCGDGVVDAGEECDDGNSVNTDSCRNDCTAPVCGDGVVDAGEECDDGNSVNTDSCRNDCTAPFCGDGIVDVGEACDDGNNINTDSCRNDCTAPVCGDGVVDAGEECDDGNSVNTDSCRNDCTEPFCGDGIIDAGEDCDDGNNVNGDGCENDCTDSPFCSLSVEKTCRVSTPPAVNYVCTKPIDVLTMVWQGSAPVRVNAWKGSVGSSTLLASMALVSPGEPLSVSGYAGSPNDVYWEIFNASTGAKIGESTFHVSCSDSGMDGPEDCGSPEGDGKGRSGFLNLWTLEGLSGGGATLTCSAGGSGFPTNESCEFASVPGPSCEALGKPSSLTFEYTGNACDPSANNQGSKAECTGFGALASTASLFLQKDADKFIVQPSGTLALGDTVTISTLTGGDFPSEILVLLAGGSVQQSLKIHTSCSAPLAVGDEFGGLRLVAFDGQSGGVEVTYGYRVTNNGDALSNVTLVDSVLGTVTSPFSLPEGESREFTLSSTLTGSTTNTVTATGSVGSGMCQAMDSTTVEVTPPVGSCADGKPTALTFEYLGGGCTTTGAQGDKFLCSGFGPTSSPVRIMVTKDADKISVTPATQSISVNDTFEVRMNNGGALPSDTKLAVTQNGMILQTLSVHTSCSQPLRVGDQFGSVQLVGFQPVP